MSSLLSGLDLEGRSRDGACVSNFLKRPGLGHLYTFIQIMLVEKMD